MRAVGGDTVDHEPRRTQLRPTDPALVADPAPAVVMVHDSLTNACLRGTDAGADGGDNPTGLVTCNHRAVACVKTKRRDAAVLRAIHLEVTAAHPRSFDLEDDFARTRGRVREFHQFDLPIAVKNDATHGVLLRLRENFEGPVACPTSTF